MKVNQIRVEVKAVAKMGKPITKSGNPHKFKSLHLKDNIKSINLEVKNENSSNLCKIQ